MKLVSLLFAACMVASLGAMDISKTYFKFLPAELKKELASFILNGRRKECAYINSIQANPCVDIPLDCYPDCFYFDSSSNALYAANTGKIEVWDLGAKKLINKIKDSDLYWPSHIFIDQESNKIIVSNWASVLVFDLRTNTRIFKQDFESKICSCAFDTENKSLVIIFLNGSLRRLQLTDSTVNEIRLESADNNFDFIVIEPITKSLVTMHPVALTLYEKLSENQYARALQYEAFGSNNTCFAANKAHDTYFVGKENGRILIQEKHKDPEILGGTCDSPVTAFYYDEPNNLLISAQRNGTIEFWDSVLRKHLHSYKLSSNITFFSFDTLRNQMIAIAKKNYKATIRIIPFGKWSESFFNQYLLSSKLYQCKIANRDLDFKNEPTLLQIYLSIPPQQRAELEDEVRIIGQGITGGQAYLYSILEAAKAKAELNKK